MDLQDWRDVIIIVTGALMILVLIALFVFTVVVGLSLRAVLRALDGLLKSELVPLTQSARQTLQQVRGTIAFISEKLVSPIVRIYGIFAGLRRMIAVLTGMVDRVGRRH